MQFQLGFSLAQCSGLAFVNVTLNVTFHVLGVSYADLVAAAKVLQNVTVFLIGEYF